MAVFSRAAAETGKGCSAGPAASAIRTAATSISSGRVRRVGLAMRGEAVGLTTSICLVSCPAGSTSASSAGRPGRAGLSAIAGTSGAAVCRHVGRLAFSVAPVRTSFARVVSLVTWDCVLGRSAALV